MNFRVSSCPLIQKISRKQTFGPSYPYRVSCDSNNGVSFWSLYPLPLRTLYLMLLMLSICLLSILSTVVVALTMGVGAKFKTVAASILFSRHIFISFWHSQGIGWRVFCFFPYDRFSCVWRFGLQTLEFSAAAFVNWSAILFPGMLECHGNHGIVTLLFGCCS